MTSPNHQISRSNFPPFGVWLTGLPASGKSTIVSFLRPRFETLGVPVEVLESDALRRLLTPVPTYAPAERDLFYRALAVMGSRLVCHGVAVIFDATANRQAYRDFARTLIPSFLEVAVDCPLETCMARDRKGTYRTGLAGGSATVPGLQEPYESPLKPEIRIDTTRLSPEAAATLIFDTVRKMLGERRD